MTGVAWIRWNAQPVHRFVDKYAALDSAEDRHAQRHTQRNLRNRAVAFIQ